ncbi:MAG: RNA polymerase sigma factor [Planctomycetes bacterium]|nr:RNA polymerase sigma factor [Planctomycetota bacterium]
MSEALLVQPASSAEFAGDDVDCSDRELLTRFLAGQQAAFTTLVQRHTGLVSGVCRRVLQQTSDVEDAFQATFLVLARKARTLVTHESVAGWLHQTARRTALKLRGLAARRRLKEGAAARQLQAEHSMTAAPADSEAAVLELAELLDAEVDQLPPIFREVILLTQVAGLSRDEVAQRLGLSPAAVKDRLERGREQLRKRLLRRGVSLSGALLAVWLAPAPASAAGWSALAGVTSQTAGAFATGTLPTSSMTTATTLAQGVLKMMGLEKLKTVAVCLISLLTAGSLAYGMLRDDPQRFEMGLRGELVTVSPTAVTIRLDEFQTLLSLNIAPQARVWTAYEPGQLADLRAGQYASLRLAADHRTVNEIHIAGAKREVTIQRMGPGRLVTAVDVIDDDDDESAPQPQPREFQLAADAIVRIGGLPATPQDLKPGMRIPLEFNRLGQTVNAVELEGDEFPIVNGAVIAIDTQTGRIQVAVDTEDDGGAHREWTLSAETLILLDGKPAQAGDLKAGSEIRLRLADDQQTVRAIRAVSPEPEQPDEPEEPEDKTSDDDDPVK